MLGVLIIRNLTVCSSRVANLHCSSPISAVENADKNNNKGVGGVSLPGPLRSGTQAAYRKGTGGRASFSGNVITVFGTTGFLGLTLVNRLLKQGAQVIIPYRCDPYYLRSHKVCSELGQMLFFPFDLRDENSIRKVVKYSNIVINMIGSHIETKKYSFYDTHVEGARNLARISREMGVDRFIHFSAMNAVVNPEPVLIPGGSHFLRSKALGELAVREEFPLASIVRPANMYGENDKFISSYMHSFRKSMMLDNVSMYKLGEHTYKMPVFMGDVAYGVQKLVNDPSTVGQTFEFVGYYLYFVGGDIAVIFQSVNLSKDADFHLALNFPYCYQLAELVDYIYHKGMLIKEFQYNYSRVNGYGPWITAVTNWYEIWQYIRKVRCPINWEWFETTECTSDLLTGMPGLLDVGLPKLTEFEHVGGNFALQVERDNFLDFVKVRYHPSFEDVYGEIEPAPMPLRSAPIYKKKPPSINVKSTESKNFDENIIVNV